MKELEPNNPQYTDVEQLTQWRKSWDQLKDFREAVIQGLYSHGMNEEMVNRLTDHFLDQVSKKWEEDPEIAKEYMIRVVQIANDEPRNNPTESTRL